MTGPADMLREGVAMKRAALDILEQHRRTLIRRGRRALIEELLKRNRATIDTVREAVPVPAGIDPKLFGTVPTALVVAGLIRAVQARRTNRPQAHARWVTVWELADRDGALAWLASHPDLPDADPGDARVRDPRQRDLFPNQ